MGLESLFSTHLAAEVAVQVLGKGTILLLLAGAAARILRRGTPGQRHAVWSGAFLLALLLPVLGAVLPARELPLLAYPADVLGFQPEPAAPLAGDAAGEVRGMRSDGGPVDAAATGASTGVAPEAGAAPAGRGLVPDGGTVALGFLLVWAAGSLLLAVRLAGHWVRTAVLTAAGRAAPPGGRVAELVRREAARLDLRRGVQVVFSDRLGVPATGGLLRPVLILPGDAAGWPEGRLRAVVLHELMHVRRWDLLAHQLAEVTRIVYWINPLLWLAHRTAAAERERACDREVVRSGIPAPEYAGVLVDMARRCRAPSPALDGTLAMARPGGVLRGRVEAVLDGSVRRAVPGRAAVVAGLLLALGSLPLATVEVLAVPPGSGPVAELTGALGDPPVEVRLRAVRNLMEWCRGEATMALARALRGDDDARVRQAAASALGRHGQPGSLPALERAAADGTETPGVRAAAVEAMGSVRHAATIPVLRSLLDDREAAIRWLAIKNLGTVAVTVPPDPALMADLERSLRRDAEPRNRLMAAVVLHRIGCEDAAAALERALRHDASGLVRDRIAALLGHAGPRSDGRTTGRVGSPPTA